MHFWSQVHMLPLSKKQISKCSNNLKLNFACSFPHSMCPCSISLTNDIFCALCKKDKNMSQEMLYFSTDFCHFYAGCTKSRILLKQLCEHIKCDDIHATFFAGFFWHFQICLKCIPNKGSICTWEPNCHVRRKNIIYILFLRKEQKK